MPVQGSNVCVGIDAGSVASKLAYSDSLSTRIIAQCEGFDPLELREEAEIFFDEPVFSCVVALNEGTTARQKDVLVSQAKSSGFREVETIPAHDAIALGLDDDARVLVYDFGASRSEMIILEGGEVLESDIIPDVCGNEFDKAFSEYLCELRGLKKIDEALIREARRLKHILSEETSRMWHNFDIQREDFTRLVRFPVRRASHTVNMLMKVWKPSRFVLTGGCANIPMVREVFGNAEITGGLIVRGASLRALALTKKETRRNIADNISRMKGLRADILGIEEKLTRSQKDRLYVLFRQVEGMNDAGMTSLLEGLVREIKQA